MKNKNNLLLIFLIVMLFWKFIIPGPKAANDYPYIYPDALKEAFNLPSTWLSRGGEGMGEYGILTMWSWPTDFLYGLGGKLGLSFDFLERVLGGLLAIFIGVYALQKLLKKYDIEGLPAFVATLFYLTTTYFILLLDGGQFLIALAYSFMPLAFYLLQRATGSNLKEKLVAALAICVIGFFDIRFVYVLLILYLIYFLYELVFFSGKKSEVIYDSFKTGVIALLVYVGLNFYWILPLILTKNSSLGVTFSRLTEAQSLNFTSVGHALYLLQPHWFKNVFGKITDLRPEFVLIPFLVFLAPLAKKSKNLGFWLTASLIGVFLVKGSNPPFGNIYTWLFSNIPGFSLFRDSTKFFFLVALAYSVLIGYTARELSKRINRKLKLGNIKINIVPLILISYLILLISPVWLGKMTGTFSDPLYKDEFFKIAEILKNDPNFGRVFWIPSRSPLGYSSYIHPSAEGLRIVERRPFYVGTVGTYEILNFLRESPYMGELFDIAGISYVAYSYPDIRREELSDDNREYYFKFSDQIHNLDWIAEKLSDYPLNLFKTKENKDKFFIPGNTWLVIGSDRIYNEFGEDKYGRLSDNALIFTEDTYDARRFVNNEFINILDYELAGSIHGPDEDEFFYTYKNPLFLSSILTDDPKDNNGWWKKDESDFLWLRNFLETKYGIDYQEFSFGHGVAISEGTNKLTVKMNNLSGGEYLFARYLLSSKGGKIKFYQGDKLIFEAQTKIENNEEVTRLLAGYGEIPKQEFKNEKENIFKVENRAKVNYKRISQSHYKAYVEGLKKPSTLVFSETYDPMWEMDGIQSYPVYSFLNGFYVEKDGEYDIYYKPQKYVLPGLIVSGLTLIATLGLLFRISKKKNNTN